MRSPSNSSDPSGTRHAALCSIAALLLFVAAPALLAQDPGPATRTALNGTVELRSLVDLCAERLDLNIQYDASTLQGTVTLKLGDPVTDEELWTLTNHVLASRGFTTVRTRDQGLISVVKMPAATNLGRLEDPRSTALLPGFVTTVVRVRHVAVKEAVDALKLVLTGSSASVAPLGASGLLLISDLHARVEQALEILELLDTPLTDTVIEAFPVKNLLVSSVANVANDILQARDAASGRTTRGKIVPLPDATGVMLVCPQEDAATWRAVLEQLRNRGVRSPVTYSPRYFPLAEVAELLTQVVGEQLVVPGVQGFRIVQDDFTGTLIVTATPSEHERVAAVIDRLNEIPPESRRQVKAYPIRNRGVNEVLTLLEKLVSARVLDETGDAGSAQGAARPPAQTSTRDAAAGAIETKPAGATPPRPPRSRGAKESQGAEGAAGAGGEEALPLTLAADEATNTLLAVGEPRLLEQLDVLVQKLDLRQPQVLLEMTLVSLSDGESFDLGIELRKLEQNGATQVALSSLFGLGSAQDVLSIPPLLGRGLTGAVLSPGDFSILLRALETLNDGRSLSFPRFLVNNNQEAQFDSVLQQPFLSTNASDTVATTSFGGTQDAGLSVTVKPQIAEGDHLVLEYTISLSEFIGESSDPALPPPRQQNNLNSTVTLPDGFTVITGGLAVTSEAEAISQTPFLGSLPLFGALFQSRSSSSSRTRFFVFIRPSILRHGGFEDLKYLSAKERRSAGVAEDSPEVKPRVIH